MPFQLLDFFKLRFDFPDRFEVVLRDRRRRAAEQSIVRLDLEPQVVRTIGHDDFPKHPPPISGAGGPVRGPCERLRGAGAGHLASGSTAFNFRCRLLALIGKDREYALPFGFPRCLRRSTQLEGLFSQ
ncbi:MAG: hypothetical protein KGQ82_09700 [Alphaproteobacteria bacterium]|nr:hypothetical protein [Alphaproteobacteria bacterium]